MKLSKFKQDGEIFKMAMQDLLPKEVLKKEERFSRGNEFVGSIGMEELR